jgi:MFS family permease
MARWTLAGSVGIVAGPLLYAGVVVLGGDWRVAVACVALLFVVGVAAAARIPILEADEDDEEVTGWRDVVTARDPALAAVVRKLDREPLSEKEREGLRSILADELCDRGLDDDDEPTSYGKALDGILGKLMFY